MYKIINRIDELKLGKCFAPTKSGITRNAEHQFYVEYSKTNVRKFTFSNRVAPAWNALSLITKSAPNINKFKNLLDRRVPDLLVNKLDCYSYFFLKDNCSMFVQT